MYAWCVTNATVNSLYRNRALKYFAQFVRSFRQMIHSLHWKVWVSVGVGKKQGVLRTKFSKGGLSRVSEAVLNLPKL